MSKIYFSGVPQLEQLNRWRQLIDSIKLFVRKRNVVSQRSAVDYMSWFVSNIEVTVGYLVWIVCQDESI